MNLDVEDVENHPEGLLIWRRRSKTDQEAEGHHIEVAYGEQLETCPIRAYRTWIDESGIETGAIFRSVNRHGRLSERRLGDCDVARIIKKALARLGYDTNDFAGHSLRRGSGAWDCGASP